MTPVYYNEIEPFAVAWLNSLSNAGHIASGFVDARSISDVRPVDVLGFPQAHFFAGIGVWSHALRLAGWPEDVCVWTGSCPCQPFSQAGKGLGFDDPRHLWPTWFKLIRECRPPVLFGEQVASPDGLAWLDLVSTDLEGEGYAFGAADMCAAGVGAPHIRQRLYWAAHSLPAGRAERRPGAGCGPASGSGCVGGLAHHHRTGRGEQWGTGLPADGEAPCRNDLDGCGEDGRLGHHHHPGLEGREVQPSERADQRVAGKTGAPGFWTDAEWIPCRDGKWRPVEPGTFPLVDGAPGRVGRLRAYGNAIVSEVAATFIRATMEAMGIA